MADVAGGEAQTTRPASKRHRNWDVDVSLEELVSWDVLEQFMQDIPGDHAAEHGLGEGTLGSEMTPHTAATQPKLEDSRVASSAPPAYASLWPSVIPNADGQIILPSAAGNAAALAQSLMPMWQQPGSSHSLPVPALAQTWGAEFLPSSLGGPDEERQDLASADVEDPRDAGRGAADSSVGEGRQVHKQRFVWTADLHRRFEAAVQSLGLDHAKPQAISQLMNCEGEGAPTRQNIKSHLQKYRLLMQKRARQTAPSGAVTSSGTAAGNSTSSAAVTASEGSQGRQGMGSTPKPVPEIHVTSPKELQSELEQHLERQEMNLKVQMDLQTKLHRQLLVQRQLQHQLEHSFNTPGGEDQAQAGMDAQRWQATLSLKNSLRERLTKHVVMQQEMLQHLDALVSSEVSKPAGHSDADQQGGSASFRSTPDPTCAGAMVGADGREIGGGVAWGADRAEVEPDSELGLLPPDRGVGQWPVGMEGKASAPSDGAADSAAG